MGQDRAALPLARRDQLVDRSIERLRGKWLLEERIRFLASQLDRQARLREKGMVKEEAYDEARHNLEAARARLVAVQEQSVRRPVSLASALLWVGTAAIWLIALPLPFRASKASVRG